MEHAELSDRQRNVAAIDRSGNRAELVEMLTDAAKSAERRYAAIRQDATRTDAFKAEEIGRAYDSIDADVTRRIEQMAAPVARAERADLTRLFGVDGVSGDAATLAISRRDAADRVAAAESEAERLRLLETATTSGDEVLARAVAEAAFRNRSQRAFEAFLADRPQLHDAAKRAWDREVRDVNLMDYAMLLAGLRPNIAGSLVVR